MRIVSVFSIMVMGLMLVGFTGCAQQEETAETVEEQIEGAAEQVGETVEEMGEAAGEMIEEGAAAAEEAVEEVKEELPEKTE